MNIFNKEFTPKNYIYKFLALIKKKYYNIIKIKLRLNIT